MTNKNHSCDGYLFDCRLDKEPVLVSACLLGIPCRWHGRKPKKREALIERLKKKYVLIPVCPEQLRSVRSSLAACQRLEPARSYTAQGRMFWTVDRESSHRKQGKT